MPAFRETKRKGTGSWKRKYTSRPLVQARPNYVEALRLLAEVKFEARDFSRAAYMYRRAIKVSLRDVLTVFDSKPDSSLVRLSRPRSKICQIVKVRRTHDNASKLELSGM
jgi:hypothetical protein